MAKTIKKKAAKKAAKKIVKSKKVLVKSKKKVAKKAAKKPKNFMADKWDSPMWADLKKRGVDRAVLKFEGGGDDGCIFQCELYHSDGKKAELECFGNEKEGRFVHELGEPIWDRYGGFNWFDHCDGTLVWNVKDEQLEWTGNHEPEGLDY